VGEKGIKIRDIEQLKELLGKSPIPIRSAFLFGSRARGDYLEESDWDIMIVSPEFAGIPFPERATIFLRKVPLRRVELLCYTEEEFQGRVMELGIVAEAAKGKRLV
jgi:predicted nucleotidyltransferase